MNINLKIEILKVFSLEFSMSSDKTKKDERNAKADSNDSNAAVGDTKPSK